MGGESSTKLAFESIDLKRLSIDHGLTIDMPAPVSPNRPFRYNYEPLTGSDEIRLFYLETGESWEPISGGLRHTSLARASSFSALSYAWEKQLGFEDIDCNKSKLRITKSLASALRHFRRALKDKSGSVAVLLWVDGVCIDQGNKEEQKRQVKIMDKIYRQARTVEVWLGPESDESGDAIDFVYELVEKLGDMSSRGVTPQYFEQYERYGLPAKQHRKWTALSRLLSRSWFSRVWIIQEFALAQQVMFRCGKDKHVPWPWLKALVWLCAYYKIILHHEADQTQGPDPSLGLTFMFYFRESIQKNEKPSMGEMLANTQYWDSSLAEDKVFALLGVVRDRERYITYVDYERSPAATFRLVAQRLVEDGHVLELLSQVRYPKAISSLPSWVPDWSSRRGRVGERSTGINYFKAGYETATYEPTRAMLGALGGRLSVMASAVASITQLTACSPVVTSEEEAIAAYPAWDRQCRSLAWSVSSYPTGESINEAHWRTRICNLGANMQPADDSYGRSYQAWLDCIDLAMDLSHGRHVDLEKLQRLDVESDPFATAQRHTIEGKRFAVIRDSYFAMVPAESQPSDQILIVAGAPMPFVMRLTHPEYRLIGPCYVHGMMKGEFAHQVWDYKTLV